jgi:sugar phosphate isomerase/epimerase
MRFGISTHLYHGQRLQRAHVEEIASFGFEAVELFATRSHFDYHDPGALTELTEWLVGAGLELHGIHGPAGESWVKGRWGRLYSIASPDDDERRLAVREADAALSLARLVRPRVFVMHVGLPAGHPLAARDSRDQARRSIDEIASLVAALDVLLALEVIPNDLSTPESLARLIEDAIDSDSVGICLDVGHAHLGGDVVDAIETVAEHLVTTHLHDNHGRADEHLVPFEGGIDWAATVMALQKVGYEGTMLLEVEDTGSPADVLRKARAARERFEGMVRIADRIDEMVRE